MNKLTDEQLVKADLLEVTIKGPVNCGFMDGRSGVKGYFVEQFFHKHDNAPNRIGTAFDNADELLAALAAPEKHNCEWRR